jgi:hypothetical protein
MKTDGEDPSGMGAMMAPVLGMLKGVKITATASPNGKLLSKKVTGFDQSNPQAKQMFDSLEQMLESMAIPLPEEPLGFGATWVQPMTVKSNNIEIKQTATYEIATIEGNRVSLNLNLKQTAEPQQVQHPMGVMMDLTKVEGTGSGTMILDLTWGMTAEASTDVETKMSLSIDMGGQAQAMEQTVKAKTKVKTVRAAKKEAPKPAQDDEK